MTSSHHGPYAWGYTRATMAGTVSRNTARWSKSQKAGLSSDWSLQLDSMKPESLVIADQLRRGEYVHDLYRDWETDRKSTRLNSSHSAKSRMPSSA